MFHWLLKTLAWGVGGLACTFVVLLVTFQEKIVYVPVLPGVGRKYPYTPERLRLDYEDVWLKAADGVKLHAWFLKLFPAVTGPTVLFFQENAGNIGHRLEAISYLMRRLHCNVLMLSYRGYGDSEGSPSELGLTLDAQAALDHLLSRSDIDNSRIIAFGRSLGGAVATRLVHNNPGKVSALVLENTFTSILDMASKMMPFLGYVISGKEFRPLNFFVRSQWRTVDIIGKVDAPMLLISGRLDEMVPPSHMDQLHARIKGKKDCSFVEIRDGMHMDTWVRGGEAYWSELRSFVNKYAAKDS